MNLTEAAFVAVMCILVWTLLRSMPSCLDLEPLGSGEETAVSYASKTASGTQIAIMTAGFLMLGMAANNVASNLSLLYQSVDFDSDRIASVVAFFGISLAIGKCVSGLVVDKVGPYKSCGILSKFQTSHTLGGLIFTTIPGIIADRTDSYVILYMIMLVLITVSSVILQRLYHRIVC